MSDRAAPAAVLKFSEETGFSLDLVAQAPGVAVSMAGVPVPADGLVELREGPVKLFSLDILFKAQVELEGAPGQLQEASVQLVGDRELELVATVEHADTGQLLEFTIKVQADMPAYAPASGGPRPRQPDEDELDWGDEDTLEALFTDAPPPPRAEAPGDDEPDDDTGDEPREALAFEALLKAIATMDVDDHEGDLEPDEEEPMPVHDPGDARGLLTFLVEREELALEPGHTIDELVVGAAPIVAARGSADQRAERLSAWLLEQEAVEELYMDDETLASLLDQW